MNRKFQRVAVLMGGPSSEREVSLASGRAVSAALRSLGYEVADVDVRDRTLELPEGIDAVFIALHGEFGEDGGVQSILEARGIPYTGSGSEASRLAFDKILSKRLFERHAISTARYEVLRRGGRRTLKLPVVVKPPRQGSSIGLSRVMQESDWESAMETALAHDTEVLVEAFIPGRELTVGIVDDQVLPVVEIRAPDGCYDYRAKYTKGLTEYLVPAPISPAETRRCQELAWRTFTAMGCRGMGRVDIRLTPEGEPYVLEMNTIPGFTETSLLPKAARAAGLEFAALCDKILNLARC
ncbi:MAG: D-alanine--D-alanine ligase [Kiritimatiellae bacterium]|nr:D-alanine--D-alanine ligase [Kiritimatiellia bacterium]MDW8458607.1 D-alanine--D-alanine ligase [Verrucomicrobiota bacterium]